MICHYKNTHSGLCLVCCIRGCPCYDTNVFIIIKHWGKEIEEEKENDYIVS